MDAAQVTKINNALDTAGITDVIQSWSDQRDLLRDQLRLFWMSDEIRFKLWWDEAGEDVRKAMVMAAMEDMPSEGITELLDVVCPELINEDLLLLNKGVRVLQLIQNVVENKENTDPVFTHKSDMLDAFQSAELAQPLFATNSLLSLRSCLLLHFLNDIIIIYTEQNEQ
jgi:hypothetical protein